jgi:hypothetical protein
VRHILELLRAELALDLMLCGLASPAEVTRELLVPADTLVPVSHAGATTERRRR